MIRNVIAVIFGLAALAIAGVVPACSHAAEGPSKPTAVATIFCYYDILRALGGDKINAVILVPPGVSPHEYDPPAQAKAQVNTAVLIVKNGLGIDDWVDKLASGSSAKILDIGKDVKALQTAETSVTDPKDTPKDAKAEEPELYNPHIWLDPTVQMGATLKIRDALSAADPGNKDVYARNAEAYVGELKKLDADFAEAAKSFKIREFIGFHSAYDYLAHRYGLTQVAAIEEIPGTPTPAQLQKIIALIKQKNIHVIFTESALDSKAADLIVRETGVKTSVLQPLETYDNLTDTYVSLMRQNLENMKKSLSD